MPIKKIKIIASFDWSMRYTLFEFAQFAAPVVQYRGERYKLEFDKIVANPVLCGQNLSEIADLILVRRDNTNEYYRAWIEQAQNSGIPLSNHLHTMTSYDKHSAYDLFSRCLHPQDRFPKTVLLPPFAPYTDDQKRQAAWEYEQQLILQYTKYGFDNFRRQTAWEQIHAKLKEYHLICENNSVMRELFYAKHGYLQEVVQNVFNSRFPLYLKLALGHGEVHQIYSLEELFQHFDNTKGRACYLQESIQDFDEQITCLSIGPQILPLRSQYNKAIHERYSSERVNLSPEIYERLCNYCRFIGAYYHWSENAIEVILQKNCIIPMDVSNPIPDTDLLLLHVHFPWVICAQLLWFSFLSIHHFSQTPDQQEYLRILQDPKKSSLEKYEFHAKHSLHYFDLKEFQEFCKINFSNITEKMVQFYDTRFDEVIRYAIYYSEFPKEQHEHWYQYYKNLMEKNFRPSAKAYLSEFF